MNVRAATLLLVGAMSVPWYAAGAGDHPGRGTVPKPGAKVIAVAHEYVPSIVPMVQGRRLSFTNPGPWLHTLTSVQRDDNGAPVFHSGLVGFASTAEVAGAARLKPGSYEFYCWLHPWMRGRLIVIKP